MYPVFKRLFDLLGAAVALVILSPLLVAVAAAIRFTSPGPVLYRAPRVGRNGVPFRMLKFRSMVPNADRVGGSSTPDDDPRVTPIGRWLRRHKLDELPQLLNVLGGSMSLVGPRPQVQWAVDRYTAEERRVLTVKPGITDYASLRFPNEGDILRGSSDPDRTYFELIHPEKMRLSLQYLDRRSLLTDASILFQTVAAVFRIPRA